MDAITVEKTDPKELAKRMEADSEPGPIVVCAYADDAKHEQMNIKGSIPRSKFESDWEQTPKERTIAFY